MLSLHGQESWSEEIWEPWLNDMQMIQDGNKDYHDMEYRVCNKSGRVIWVSCREP